MAGVIRIARWSCNRCGHRIRVPASTAGWDWSCKDRAACDARAEKYGTKPPLPGQVFAKEGKRRLVHSIKDRCYDVTPPGYVGAHYVIWGKPGHAASQMTWWVDWHRWMKGATLEKTMDTRDLIRSLSSDLCPACGKKKRPQQTLCGKDYQSLPSPIKTALYDHVGQGYEEAFAAAMKHLKVSNPMYPAKPDVLEPKPHTQETPP